MATDRLTLAHAFEDAGMERAKAENAAQVVMDAINDHVATKADIVGLATKVDIVDIKTEIAEIKAALRFQQWQLAIIAAMILGILAKLFYR